MLLDEHVAPHVNQEDVCLHFFKGGKLGPGVITQVWNGALSFVPADQEATTRRRFVIPLSAILMIDDDGSANGGNWAG